jgi:hypothetical protein
LVLRTRFTHALDWLALLLAVAATAIAIEGSLSIRFAGLRITASSPHRAILAMLALLALRFALDRRTRLFDQARSILHWLRDRFYHPDADARPPLPEETKWRRRGVALLGFTAFAAVFFVQQLRAMDSLPDFGDPLFSIWRTGWLFHKLVEGDPRPLFSPNIFHPHPLTLTYSDSMLLPSLTTVPLLILGVHPVVAYNLVLIASFIASALAMYMLVERLTGAPFASFVAGLLFGFHPYRLEHYSHFELLMTYCMPLALLALHRFVDTPKWRYAIALAVLAAGQLYSSMYYAVFFTIYATAVLVALVWVTRAPVRKLLLPLAAAGALALVLAWPLARVYRAAHLGDRDIGTVEFYSATVADYFQPHWRLATWGHEKGRQPRPERALFPGAMIFTLAAIGLLPRFGRIRVVYLIGLIVAFELSRGFNDPIYRWLYDLSTAIRGLRATARASILVGMTLAVLAGFGARRFFTYFRSPMASRLALAAVVIVIGIDLRPRHRFEHIWLEPPPIYKAISGPKFVLAEFPMGMNPSARWTDTPHMYFSLWHWAQLLNGYSGHAPETNFDQQTAMRAFPADSTIDILRAKGTTHVSIICALYNGGCEQLVEKVDTLPMFRIVATGRWQGLPVRLYELR